MYPQFHIHVNAIQKHTHSYTHAHLERKNERETYPQRQRKRCVLCDAQAASFIFVGTLKRKSYKKRDTEPNIPAMKQITQQDQYKNKAKTFTFGFSIDPACHFYFIICFSNFHSL